MQVSKYFQKYCGELRHKAITAEPFNPWWMENYRGMYGMEYPLSGRKPDYVLIDVDSGTTTSCSAPETVGLFVDGPAEPLFSPSLFDCFKDPDITEIRIRVPHPYQFSHECITIPVNVHKVYHDNVSKNEHLAQQIVDRIFDWYGYNFDLPYWGRPEGSSFWMYGLEQEADDDGVPTFTALGTLFIAEDEVSDDQ